MKALPVKKYGLILFPVCSVIFSTLLVCSCARAKEPISRTGFYFNTVITLTLYDTQEDALLDDCMAIADKYEKMFSTTIATSDISRINRAGGAPVPVEDETIDLLQRGLEYSKLSGGRFDVTIGKLSSLWNFSENDGIVPPAEQIAAAVSTIDYHNVKIDGDEVTLTDPNAAIDLGGIAKGYIADQMKAFLTENGVASAMINLGGNVLAIGEKPDHCAFQIGIQKPFDKNGSPIAIVSVKDKTVVSSGVYERCFTADGVLYHHILDPSTGYPYDNGLLGVTIICQNSADGDGLSTTCFALGLEKGIELVESLDDVEAIFITSDYKLHTSSGIGTEIPFQEL